MLVEIRANRDFKIGATPDFETSGIWAGEWLFVSRYASWEVYGNAQQGLAKDPAFAKLLANMTSIAQLMGRNITVSVDL